MFKLNNNNKTLYHFFFLFIISLKFILPFLIFNDITLFYIDALDSEIVYNKIIGKILNGNLNSINLFLGGEYQINFLRRIHQPYMYVYALLNTEHAYFFLDTLIKIISYFSFFILAKKINNNLIICCLISCLYSLSNQPAHEGFGLAILPYIVYLGFFKKKLLLRHYLIIILFGLNSDLISTGITLPTIGLLFLFYQKKKIIHYFKILLIFFLSIVYANRNLIEITLNNTETHRQEFIRKNLDFLDSITYFLSNILQIPFNFDLLFLMKIPYVIFILPIFFAFFIFKEKQFKMPLYIIFITSLFLILVKSTFISNYINNSTNILKTVSWGYLTKSFIFLYILSIIFFLNRKSIYSKFIYLIICLSIFIFLVNASIVPFVKSKIKKLPNYQNFYTFQGYYNHFDYKLIKTIVGNDRTLSIGVDPMVAAYNDIYVVDGYHSIYPLSYKKKFREIILPELEKNLIFKNYFDSWGSRLYSTAYQPIDKNNIELNFQAAKKLGVKFIISKYILNSEQLKLISDKCKQNDLCLYKINEI